MAEPYKPGYKPKDNGKKPAPAPKAEPVKPEKPGRFDRKRQLEEELEKAGA